MDYYNSFCTILVRVWFFFSSTSEICSWWELESARATLSQILFITFMNFYRISRSSQIMDAFLFGGLGITYLLFAEGLVLWFINLMDRIFRHSQVVEDI